MRLLIISNMAHYVREGTIVGWGPAVTELNHVARLFEDVRHVACLHETPPPPTALPYEDGHVALVGVPPTGGTTAGHKLAVARALPLYFRTIQRELAGADAVHVRAPANVSLVGLLALTFSRRPTRRWVKYAGSWRGYPGEPASYALQRRWLASGLCRATVSINGAWPEQPPHVKSLVNPCLTRSGLARARSFASVKQLDTPIRLLFAGALVPHKGVAHVLATAATLKARGVEFVLDVAGDGPERSALEAAARLQGLDTGVLFHGWLSREALDALYARAHLIVLPSRTEGWPKVLGEAMAFGVVPLASGVGSIPYYLQRFGSGRVVSGDPEAWALAVDWYRTHPEAWHRESRAAAEAGEDLTYEALTAAVAAWLKP